jgi:Domain of unknown function (DUF4328)
MHGDCHSSAPGGTLTSRVASAKVHYEPPKARLEDLKVEEYRNSTQLAQWTLYLLYAKIAVSLLAIWSGVLEHQTLMQLANGVFESPTAAASAAQASDVRQAMFGAVQSIIFMVCGFFCLRWIHRMCFNARIQARHMQFTPGWSIGWYFVPIAYWWKPYRAMQEIWQESVDQAPARGSEAPGLLGLWWTLWIIFALLSNASLRMSMRVTNLDGALVANYVALACDILQVPLCIVFIVMVQKLTAMQEYAHDNPRAPDSAAGFPGANWSGKE